MIFKNLSKLSPISIHRNNQKVSVQSYSDVSSDPVNSVACRRRRGCNNIDIDIDIDICIDNGSDYHVKVIIIKFNKWTQQP
ncbi:hypothetical protein DFA_02635 [Cavenderia fasciculata]|uniref:Uncharacterized protein n=1 Tax=Cavenderia fasciculata TaxID=261658 RepID=F4PZY2_CACFS|nr:uncharacterized protein DFA_02635 [Cavenderia fasciculata]EGG18896.1 hypothetical protein DFA_02635 [Cavenderia fasciculata]|eukprot:XP_004357358.1 hypothetical protein DFA_02635 [Cavenderia fasciculata]